MPYLNNSLLTDEILSQVHWYATVPALIILYITIIFIFLIIGLIVAMKFKTTGRYMVIWFLSSFISAVILIALILLRFLVVDIVNFLF